MSGISEEKLQQIQDEIMQSMNREQAVEKEIIQSADSIASQLLFKSPIAFEIDDKVYDAGYRLIEKGSKKWIYMIITNRVKQQLAGGKYVPFTATGEVDIRYSMKDNLKAVVETFIRHVTGNIKPEIMED